MAVNFLLKRSNTASKRPTAAQLDIGELSLNYDANTAGVFFEDGAGNVRKVGPAEVSATAPNATPAGSSGNSLGEFWYDTGATNLKIWTGSAFVNATSSITGNAGTVTNGVYTTGAQTIGGTKTFSSQIIASGGIQPGATDYPNYEALIDFGSDVANTWRRLVQVVAPNVQYSTIGFKIDVVDPQANHATTNSVDQIRTETYYVACVRANDVTLDVPDACYVRGPSNRIRATKTAVGTYEIHIQNAAQFREYRVNISVYAYNGAQVVSYFDGDTANAGTAQYNASASTGSYDFFQGIQTFGNVLPGTTNTYNLGAAGTVWSNVYATTFTGALSGNSTTATSLSGGSIGTIPYQSATNTTAMLAVGTAGQALVSAGAAAPTWATLTLENLPDAAFKRSVRVATTADLGASTFAAGVLTGYDDVISLNVTTTLSSTTATTTSTAGIKVGAVISGNANIPAATTVASITNATTFVMSAAATAAGSAVATTFTQTISALVIDGVTLALNDRVLVKNQSTLGGLADASGAAKNGVYRLSTLGSATVPWVLTRTADADSASELGGALVNADSGTVNGGLLFDTDFKTTDTLNTTNMVWSRVVDTGMGNTTAATIAMNGTQAAGTSDLYARADHVHPTDTSRAATNQTMFIGTTSFAINRASAAQSLTGITSIDGSAATLTTTRTLWGQNFNGGANVTGSLTSVGDITATAAITISSTTTSAITVDSGTTGNVNLGTNANAKAIAIGNATVASTIALNNNTTLPAGKTLTLSGATSGTIALQATATAGTNTITFPATTGTVALTANNLGVFAATTSAQLAGVISDETGTGSLVFGTNPLFDGETYSTSATVTAGTNAQGQGALTSDYNVITTAASAPSGVTLPTATVGRRIIIVNKGANAVNIYPATGAAIDALAANASIQLAVNGVMMLNAASATLWYSSVNMQTLAAVADGDKGDITVSGSGATWTIDNTAVTYAKIQNVSTNNRILGRSTAGAGSIEELTTIPSTVLGNSSLFIGTTSIALNRASASQSLTGVNIDGSAGSATNLAGGSIGTIPYQSASGTTAMLAVGAAGQALVSAGAAAPTWATLTLENIPDAAFKRSVKAATTANITLSGTQTIDGIAVVANDRVLVKNQSAPAQNGIYVVSATAWSRAADANSASEIAGGVVNVDSGTQGGQLWTTNFKTTDTLDTTAMNWYVVAVGDSSTYALSISGSAATLTTTRTLWGQNFNGSANVTGNLTSVGNITGSGAVTLSSAAASALNLNSGTTGAVTLDSGSTGAVNIGNNANAKTITLGNVTGATTINVNSGTGGILVTSPHLTMANQGALRLREATGGGTNYIGLQAPAAVAADLTFTVPGTDATTTTGYTLKSNGSAALSFGTANIVTSDTAPSSPLDGDLWYDSASGRLFVYYADANTNQWVDASPDSSGVSNIRILDSIAASFNGTTATFNLTVSAAAVSPVNAQQLLIVVGGVVQMAGTHYTVSGSTITFTAGNIPTSGLTFYGVIYGDAATLNTIADGAVTTAKIQNASVTAAKLSIDGNVLPTVDNTYNLGSASFRFANVYTGDLHLKNDRGDWTIIEEDDCLTMRNNKTGKIYEIMMKERTA